MDNTVLKLENKMKELKFNMEKYAIYAIPKKYEEGDEVKRLLYYKTLKEFQEVRKEKEALEEEIRLKELKNKNKYNSSNKTFINSFGEATKRNIETQTYKRQQSKINKLILRNLGY